jgi:hypothetical protein
MMEQQQQPIDEEQQGPQDECFDAAGAPPGGPPCAGASQGKTFMFGFSGDDFTDAPPSSNPPKKAAGLITDAGAQKVATFVHAKAGRDATAARQLTAAITSCGARLFVAGGGMAEVHVFAITVHVRMPEIPDDATESD